MEKQKIDLVKPYATRGFNDSYFSFENLPPEVAKQLLGKWPNANKTDCQNSSPTMEELIELCSQHQGTLEGYCIPVESGREDARIIFDGCTLHITKQEAMELKEKLTPNEFDKKDKDTFRFWWD